MKKMKKLVLYLFLLIIGFTVPITVVEAADKITAKTVLQDALNKKQKRKDQIVVTLNKDSEITKKEGNVKNKIKDNKNYCIHINQKNFIDTLHYETSSGSISSGYDQIRQYKSASNNLECYIKEADNTYLRTDSIEKLKESTLDYKKTYKYMKDIRFVKNNVIKEGQKAYYISANFNCAKYLSEVDEMSNNFALWIRSVFPYSTEAKNIYAKVSAYVNVETGQLINMKFYMNQYVKKVEKLNSSSKNTNVKSTDSYIMIQVNPSKCDKLTTPSEYKTITYALDDVVSEIYYQNKLKKSEVTYLNTGFVNAYYDDQGKLIKKITTNYADEFSTCVQYKDGKLVDTSKIDRMDSVTVSNVKQFVDAIGKYNLIYLEAGTYNLSNIKVDTDTRYSNNVYVNTTYDGHEFYFCNVDHLTLIGKGNVSLVIEPRYSNVLNIIDSSNVTIKNLTVGHTKDKGYCTGGVLNFINTNNVTVDSCNLYGCGTYGIITDTVSGIEVVDTQIYECSYGIMTLTNTDKALFNNCTFRDNKGYTMIELWECDSITYDKCKIFNNSMESEYFDYFIETDQSNKILFNNCEIHDNSKEYKLTKDDKIMFKDCNIR